MESKPRSRILESELGIGISCRGKSIGLSAMESCKILARVGPTL